VANLACHELNSALRRDQKFLVYFASPNAVAPPLGSCQPLMGVFEIVELISRITGKVRSSTDMDGLRVNREVTQIAISCDLLQ
jgi:hypothetical protein